LRNDWASERSGSHEFSFMRLGVLVCMNVSRDCLIHRITPE
jgi:hypothetical protein